MYFPISGVTVNPLIPLMVSFGVSFFTSMGGVSGAFLLLPFQVSILGFTSPAVSPTNLVYNVVAIPSGIYRYVKEKRMAWPLALITIAGTLPGIFIGALIRIHYISDPGKFKFFMGLVLIYIGLRLILDLIPRKEVGKDKTNHLEKKFSEAARKVRRQNNNQPPDFIPIETKELSLGKYVYSFYGETFSVNTVCLFSLAAIIGIIGGIYGIGGGAIIAPFLVAIFRLPVYTIAGAALLGTFVTSIAGILFYTLLAQFYQSAHGTIAPDWMLGVIFGIGGFLGIYCGARLQKYMPPKVIKLIICLIILFLAFRYIGDFLRK